MGCTVEVHDVSEIHSGRPAKALDRPLRVFALELQMTEVEQERFWAKVDKATTPDGCWLWTAGLHRQGYGRVRHEGKLRLAHRVAWEITNGPIPDGLCVCHNCPEGDNTACCNPAHLFLGTHADNMKDMVSKGRHKCPEQHYSITHPEKVPRGDRNGSRTHPERLRRGDNHPSRLRPETRPRGDTHYARTHPERMVRGSSHGNAKLTEDKVRLIRAASKSGISQLAIGLQHNVHNSTISDILRGKIWRHVAD